MGTHEFVMGEMAQVGWWAVVHQPGINQQPQEIASGYCIEGSLRFLILKHIFCVGSQLYNVYDFYECVCERERKRGGAKKTYDNFMVIC